jgi:hypothetical protein
MNKKEKKQFEKQLKNDVLSYLVSSDIKDLNNYKEVRKYLKKFANKYYQEVKYELDITDNGMITINYKED